MTQSSPETSLAGKRYALAIVVVLVVIPAFLKGVLAFVHAFAHTLSSIFVTLGLLIFALGAGTGGFWFWKRYQHHRQESHAVMQSTLSQLIQEKEQPFSLSDFATKVQLPLPMVKAFLETAAQEGKAQLDVNDGGEIYYDFSSESPTSEPVVTGEGMVVEVAAIAVEEATSSSPSSSKIEEVSEPSFSAKNTLDTPLIQARLAKRLKVSSSTISNRKLKPDFLTWSRQKDPEGLAWQYSPETKKFYPQA